MATERINHSQRERAILSDLESSFPSFMGRPLLWDEVSNRQDPPDFISSNSDCKIGLELREWLDGDQMGSAKAIASQREQIQRILSQDWEKGYQPKNFRGAFPTPSASERISRDDEAGLRNDFFACAVEVDRGWADDFDHMGNSYYRSDFSGFPLLGKYLSYIHYVGGEPHGLNWIGEQGTGSAFDPAIPGKTLIQALDSKLSDYSNPLKQSHLKAHGLNELNLLVHGGFNIYAYNTPSGHDSLEEISRRGAHYYAAHEHRNIFDRVWFFHSLDAADEVNQLLGFGPGEGRVRWLTQLWPEFRIYAGSAGA
jgi:hypothetical protein